MRVRVSPVAQKKGVWRNWYTRMLQEHMRAISWRFKSSHAHMKKIIIEQNGLGKRIDKFLAQQLIPYTRADVIRAIKAGQILVKGKKVKPSYLLRLKDKLEINLIKEEFKLIPNEKIKFKIVYQDKNIIIVNKPVEVLVHPANLSVSNKSEWDKTLVSGLLYKFPEIKEVGDNPEIRPGIVHRLDRDTSGLMVVARNQKTFLELKQKFKDREIKKIYWALVFGKIKSSGKPEIINQPIARASNYKKQVIANQKTKTKVRQAITYYKVLKAWDKFSLLEVRLKTGRTHQIRVHLKFIGHPIVGDQKYYLKNITKLKNISSQLLHSKKLAFKLGTRKYSFETNLPLNFQNFINHLDESAVKS